MQCLPAENFVDVKVGDFNYGRLKVTERKPLNLLIGYYQIKNKRTRISGSFLGKVCMKETVMEHFPINVTVWNIYFFDSNDIRVVIDYNAVDFDTFSKMQYDQALNKNLYLFY